MCSDGSTSAFGDIVLRDSTRTTLRCQQFRYKLAATSLSSSRSLPRGGSKVQKSREGAERPVLVSSVKTAKSLLSCSNTSYFWPLPGGFGLEADMRKLIRQAIRKAGGGSMVQKFNSSMAHTDRRSKRSSSATCRASAIARVSQGHI
jgi:hypothetical protein